MSDQTGVMSQPPTVLIIDDEDYVADMIAAVLQIEGYSTIVAYNGRDGLRQATDFRGELIIVDIMMPFMNGIDLVRHIQQQPDAPNVPIVLISAGARPRTPLPNVTFIAKPFDVEHLLAVVHELVDER